VGAHENAHAADRAQVRLCITFRVRVAVDGRRELSLKRAHEEYAFVDFYAPSAYSNASVRTRVHGTPGEKHLTRIGR